MVKGIFRKSAPSSSPTRTPQTPGVFVPQENFEQARRPYGLSDVILGLPGQLYTPEGLFVQPTPVSAAAVLGEDMGDDSESDEAVDIDGINNGVEQGEAYKKQQDKKREQWRKWSEVIIPNMLKPYLELLRVSDSLRDLDGIHRQHGCPGCNQGQARILEVSCIYFDRIVKLSLCTCTEVALQLLQLGLFPCAPKYPTLAVDLNMLDFARGLFVNAAPNLTAWCETLEGFLSARKFKLTTRDSLRGRFGAALHWYAVLVDTKHLCLRSYLSKIHETFMQDVDDIDMASPNTSDVEMGDDEPNRPSDHNTDNPSNSKSGQGIRERPSEYLRSRCPLCFGGNNWFSPDQIVDIIACLDACFTQKRQKPKGNAWSAPRQHPETVFVPQEDAEAMESLVEDVRPSRPAATSEHTRVHAQGSTANTAENAQDSYEPNIRVPISVLDGCHESFAAADANRVKASTKFFTDTGLMALLCRHDRVLWLVNMKSAGEKQHYALCLLKKLFEHIPDSMRVGCLYDIGCQLHRSCAKFGFLGEYLDRLTFGISVFHAYGHQWPCQIIYHPRKCEGFGRTDGEGCERFWSSIKGLIPSLRVSGHFTRLYTLDTQVKHLDEKSLLGLGNWLHKKWHNTAARKAEADAILQNVYECGITEAELRGQWKAQVMEQTKPLKRQASDLADKEIQSILAAIQNVEEYKKQVARYELMIDNNDYSDDLDFHEVQILKEELSLKLRNAQKSITKQKAKLSVDGRLSLEKLLGNAFLKARMNALALKQRIRDRLRNRKFELETLERAYRATVNRDKLDNNAKKQIKRKEPGIQALAKKYNKSCEDLQAMIDQKLAPRGARAPIIIETEGLFKLDVDDDIWQDIGLTNDSDDSDVIPDWLGNDMIRTGIKALLEHDRCLEEEQRLQKECIALEQWFIEEWETCQVALEVTQHDPDLMYLLELHKKHLVKLALYWIPKVQIVRDNSVNHDMFWGPSASDLENAQMYESKESVTSRVIGDEEISSDEEDNENAALFDTLESTVLAEEFRHTADYSIQASEFRGLSPMKRANI